MSFIEGNKDLRMGKTGRLCNTAKGINRVYSNYLVVLKMIFTEHNFLNRQDNIFNMDVVVFR